MPAVVFRILPDPFVNRVTFDARGFDIRSLYPHEVDRYVDDKKNFEIFQRWGLGYDHIGWNLKKPMFQDRRVRIALAHAIDIDRIIKYAYRGHARQSKGIFPEQLWFANKDLKPYPYNPQKARQLLAEAGWKDTVLVMPRETVRIITHFSDYTDPDNPYMFHCHILEHEDAGMMGQFLVVA